MSGLSADVLVRLQALDLVGFVVARADTATEIARSGMAKSGLSKVGAVKLGVVKIGATKTGIAPTR